MSSVCRLISHKSISNFQWILVSGFLILLGTFVEGSRNDSGNFKFPGTPKMLQNTPMIMTRKALPAHGFILAMPRSNYVHGRDKGNPSDLNSAAQTLYDIRGFHIPLGGAAETQQYLRQHQQSPFTFPSFYQTQTSHQNSDPFGRLPNVFGQQHEQKFSFDQGGHVHADSFTQGHAQHRLRLTKPNTPINFRPSKLDLGQSTTEDAFRPFNPPGVEQPIREQEGQDASNLHPSQGGQYIYVYDDPEDEVEVSKVSLQTTTTEKQPKYVGSENRFTTTTPRATTLPNVPQFDDFLDDEGQVSQADYGNSLPNNNLPFSEFVDDHQGQLPHAFGGHPNVEVIPSSERRPPPDARNTIPPKLADPKPEILRHYYDVQSNGNRVGNPRRTTTSVPPRPSYSPLPSPPPSHSPPPPLFPQPFQFQEVPTTQRDIEDLFGTKTQLDIDKTTTPRLEIVSHAQNENARNEYDIGITQNVNPFIVPKPFEISRPFNTIQIQDGVDYPETTYIETHNTVLENEISTTTTESPPITTKVTARPRSRFPFPPFAGRSTTTATTTTTTTTPAPRPRVVRPRIRLTTLQTTTTTTPVPIISETEYYDVINDNQEHQLVPVEPEHQEIQKEPKLRKVSTYNSFEQEQLRSKYPNPSPSTHQVEPHILLEDEIPPPPLVPGGRNINSFPNNRPLTTRLHSQPEDQLADIGPTINQPITRFRLTPAPPSYRPLVKNQVSLRPHNLRDFNENTFTVQQGIVEQPVGLDFSPTPDQNFLHQLPRGRKQPPGNFQIQPQRLHIESHQTQRPHIEFNQKQRPHIVTHQQPKPHIESHPSGKPLYITGKMLSKEGGLYAGYEIQPQHHSYGNGQLLPLPHPPIPTNPQPVQTIPPFESARQRGVRLRLASPTLSSIDETLGLRGPTREAIKPARVPLLRDHVTSKFRRPPSVTSSSRIFVTPHGQQSRGEPVVITHNVIPTTAGSETEELKPTRANPRFQSPGRRRKPKAEPFRPEPELADNPIISISTPFSIERATKLQPIVLKEPVFVTSTSVPSTPSSTTSKETSPPSLEIQLPSSPKPNPTKRRPIKRIRIPGPILASTTQLLSAELSSTTEETITAKPIRQLRPRPRFISQNSRSDEILTNTPSQSVKISRKPTAPLAKFSSKYKEDSTVFEIPVTQAAVLDQPSQTDPPNTQPPPFVSIPRSVIKIKKAQVVDPPATSPASRLLAEAETDNPLSAIPTSVFIKPKDVLSNRKPARRIPPGSASDRLKALQERRRKLFKNRPNKILTSRVEPAYDTDDQELNASEQIQQSKREIRLFGNSSNLIKPTATKRRSRNDQSRTSTMDSDESVSAGILGIPKISTLKISEISRNLNLPNVLEMPKPSEISTIPISLPHNLNSKSEFHLLWEEVKTTPTPPRGHSSSISPRGLSSTLQTPRGPSSSISPRGVSSTLQTPRAHLFISGSPTASSGYGLTSPHVPPLNRSLDLVFPEGRSFSSVSSSVSPFRLFGLTNEKPTLPIEAEFF